MKRKLAGFLAIAFAFSVATPILRADDNPEKAKPTVTESKKTAKKSSNKKAEAKTVEMFQAMEEGILTVDFIGKDAKEANLIFKNKGNDPINVVLPQTFGAVPVLAQGMMGGMMGGGGMGGMGGGGMGGMGGGGMGGMGGGQGMGGGMGGMGGGGMGGMGGGGMGGMGGGGMMGGMMRIEADTPRKMTVATLCLNHGKADPNPRMKYKVVRLAEVNDSPVIEEFCKALAAGKVAQNTAQAAAWHVANGLTWEELVRKPRVISEYTGVEMFFSKFEIQAAMRFTSLATEEAERVASYKKYNVSTSSDSQEESIGDKLAK
ncbi:MAG: hypothetical protein NTY15_04985 [Planctomycetota bacterium]|nr:hypothetical protein [Planctomycetota bacterium]